MFSPLIVKEAAGGARWQLDRKAKFDGDRAAFDTLRGLTVKFTLTSTPIPHASEPAAPATPAKPFAIPENDTHGFA